MKRSRMLVGSVCVLVFIGWYLWPRTTPISQAPRPKGPISADVFIEQTRFDFERARVAQTPVAKPGCEAMRGGVVNHHFLATDLLASFFAELRACRPDLGRVIILSPDHYHQSRHVGMTHVRSYLAQGKVMKVDAEAVARLEMAVPAIDVRDEPFELEHGIGALVPFLAKEQPDVVLVPVAIQETVDQATAGKIAAWVKGELDRDPQTFVIVSSDMSHYLTLSASKTHDGQTMEALQKRDVAFFWQATDDNTDNGKGLWIAMTALGKDKAWRQTAHDVSTEYGGSEQYTTSYVNGFWE